MVKRETRTKSFENPIPEDYDTASRLVITSKSAEAASLLLCGIFVMGSEKVCPTFTETECRNDENNLNTFRYAEIQPDDMYFNTFLGPFESPPIQTLKDDRSDMADAIGCVFDDDCFQYVEYSLTCYPCSSCDDEVACSTNCDNLQTTATFNFENSFSQLDRTTSALHLSSADPSTTIFGRYSCAQNAVLTDMAGSVVANENRNEFYLTVENCDCSSLLLPSGQNKPWTGVADPVITLNANTEVSTFSEFAKNEELNCVFTSCGGISTYDMVCKCQDCASFSTPEFTYSIYEVAVGSYELSVSNTNDNVNGDYDCKIVGTHSSSASEVTSDNFTIIFECVAAADCTGALWPDPYFYNDAWTAPADLSVLTDDVEKIVTIRVGEWDDEETHKCGHNYCSASPPIYSLTLLSGDPLPFDHTIELGETDLLLNVKTKKHADRGVYQIRVHGSRLSPFNLSTFWDSFTVTITSTCSHDYCAESTLLTPTDPLAFPNNIEITEAGQIKSTYFGAFEDTIGFHDCQMECGVIKYDLLFAGNMTAVDPDLAFIEYNQLTATWKVVAQPSNPGY